MTHAVVVRIKFPVNYNLDYMLMDVNIQNVSGLRSNRSADRIPVEKFSIDDFVVELMYSVLILDIWNELTGCSVICRKCAAGHVERSSCWVNM